MNSFELPLSPHLKARCNENGSFVLKPCQEDDRLSLRMSPEEFVALFALLHDPAIEAEVQLLHDQQMSELAPALKRANEYNNFILGGGEILSNGGSVTRVEVVGHKTLRIHQGTNHPYYDVPYTYEFRMYPSQKKDL